MELFGIKQAIDMKVLYKKTDSKAVVPKKAYDKDFCYDVVATSENELAPGVYKYGIGLAFQIDRDEMQVIVNRKKSPDITGLAYSPDLGISFKNSPIDFSIEFRPRSSVWKTGMVLSNCIGTVDELYRGEVSAVFYHLFRYMPRYKVGDRIGQICLTAAFPMEFTEAESLDETERGENGYGSTGK